MNKLTYEKSQKGITLIALVVTIIVLLILAGVSIHIVLGNNGISTSSKAYEMIFGIYANTSNTSKTQYWLASSCVFTSAYESSFRMRYINYNSGNVNVNSAILWYTDEINPRGISNAVRAVVEL